MSEDPEMGHPDLDGDEVLALGDAQSLEEHDWAGETESSWRHSFWRLSSWNWGLESFWGSGFDRRFERDRRRGCR